MRIKTDRRDATNLARLHRAGELTPVWVPDQAIVDRRIGRNELSAIRKLLACVNAQHDYFERAKQANGSGV